MTELRIEQVSRTFPARQGNAPTKALEPTDLTVGNNDFVTILGPSGCGKSTLLRLVAGLDRPSTGRILLDGRPVAAPGPDRGAGGKYLIVGPDWKGQAPAGSKLIQSPTTLVWLIGRTLVDGEKDLPNVTALQQQFQLQILPPASDATPIKQRWNLQAKPKRGFPHTPPGRTKSCRTRKASID